MQSEALTGVWYLRPVFFVAVAFIIFFVLFGRTLWRAIGSNLDSRILAVRRELDEASRLRAEAEAMLADAQAQRREATAQAEAMLASAGAEAQRLSVTMAADAKTAAERRERMAIDRIAAAEASVLTEMRAAAVALAAEATTHVLQATLSEQDDAALIDRAIAALPTSLRAA